MTSSGQPILSTALGILTLAARGEVALGTRMSLEMAGARPGVESAGARPGGPLSAAPLQGLSQSWGNLDDALRALPSIDPAMGGLDQQVLPRAGRQLTASLAFFISALKGGDIRSWLGDGVMRTLERGRPGTGAVLGEEFRSLSRAAETGDTGWRGIFVPLFEADDSRQLRLFVHPDEHGADGGEGGGTRFLVDLALSAVGDFQIDGLVRRDRIDLMIRTAEPMPAEMRADIRTIFTDTLRGSRLTGTLDFRAGAPAPLPVDGVRGYKEDVPDLTA